MKKHASHFTQLVVVTGKLLTFEKSDLTVICRESKNFKFDISLNLNDTFSAFWSQKGRGFGIVMNILFSISIYRSIYYFFRNKETVRLQKLHSICNSLLINSIDLFKTLCTLATTCTRNT